MTEEAVVRFSSSYPVIILTREANSDTDWQEVDRGPGYFQIPTGEEIRVKIKSINDFELAELVTELQGVSTLRFLDLAENRNVTNDGMVRLKALTQLTGLNLSSCSITSTGIVPLRDLTRLEHLNLAYCNKLTDQALKTIQAMRNLTFVDLQGCVNITQGGISRMRHKNLTVKTKK